MNTILMVAEITVMAVIAVCIILVVCLYFKKGKDTKKNVGGGGEHSGDENGRPLPPEKDKNKENN